MIQPVRYERGKVILLDQRELPLEEIYREFGGYREVIEAIKEMVVRGAPVIGLAGAAAYAVGSHQIFTDDTDQFFKDLHLIGQEISKARPTAVNLSWAIQRMERVALASRHLELTLVRKKLDEEVNRMILEDININQKIGLHGNELIQDGDTLLTHCNAGALATGGYGTALGVIRTAWHTGKKIRVIANETRPFLQGARLTTWELMKDNIPVTLITDNMAGYFMSKGLISKVIVGADRIAANGDVANKIGTYTLAVLAINHRIPFFVAAPLSTIDLETSQGTDIPIEERSATEVTHFKGMQIAPIGIEARNPAFDITPHELVSAFITEKGLIHPPYQKNIPLLFQ